MTKAIFLDFDGPLHPTESIRGINRQITQYDIDSRMLFRWVSFLEEVVENSPDNVKENLFIVAHSSWRMLKGLDQDLIRSNLGKLAKYYVGMTDPELARWPSIVKMCERANFDDIIILDDAASEFPEGLEQLVVCSPTTGLSDLSVMKQVDKWLAQEKHQRVFAPSNEE